jgi:hypothetical protein
VIQRALLLCLSAQKSVLETGRLFLLSVSHLFGQWIDSCNLKFAQVFLSGTTRNYCVGASDLWQLSWGLEITLISYFSCIGEIQRSFLLSFYLTWSW